MDYPTLKKWLKDNGYQLVQPRRNSHFFVYAGETRVGTLASTPSDWRSVRNDIGTLRRNGVPIPRKGEPL